MPLTGRVLEQLGSPLPPPPLPFPPEAPPPPRAFLLPLQSSLDPPPSGLELPLQPVCSLAPLLPWRWRGAGMGNWRNSVTLEVD